MAFKPLNTKDAKTGFRKILIYAPAGWGKTTQALYFQKHFGKGFILSGEAGLSSVRTAGIDYLPFSSFDGKSDPANSVYSFAELCRTIQSPEFKAAGYKWLMLDSLTELSDMVMAWSTAKVEREAAEAGKKPNGFEKFGSYAEKLLQAIKFFRDLDYHIVVSALHKETENDDGAREVLPSVQGNKVQGQLAGIFDLVLAGVTTSVKTEDGKSTVTKRMIVTSDTRGWRAKVRDEHRVLSAVEDTSDVTDILRKLDKAEAE